MPATARALRRNARMEGSSSSARTLGRRVSGGRSAVPRGMAWDGAAPGPSALTAGDTVGASDMAGAGATLGLGATDLPTAATFADLALGRGPLSLRRGSGPRVSVKLFSSMVRAVTGNSMMKLLPTLPGPGSYQRCPRCAATIPNETERPSPVPSPGCFVVKKLSLIHI